MTYYAYIHCKPDGTPFYVGKGKGRRAYDFNRSGQNAFYANTVAKYGTPLVGKLECSSEEIAFDLEKGIIKCLRRMGVKLANLSDGGEGQSGFIHTEETKRKIGEKPKGQVKSEECRKKMSLKQLGEQNSAKLPGVGSKISKALAGRFWITNGLVSKRVEPSYDIPDGWQLGRGKIKYTPRKDFVHPTTGKIWITDGVLSRRAFPNDPIPDGWKRGRK